jgi:hypothetical protein
MAVSVQLAVRTAKAQGAPDAAHRSRGTSIALMQV